MQITWVVYLHNLILTRVLNFDYKIIKTTLKKLNHIINAKANKTRKVIKQKNPRQSLINLLMLS